MTEINLVCAADLHLGRQVGHRNSRQQRSYVIQAWERLIDACLNEQPKVDALLLAGDLIDKDGLFIEMHGIFRKGILKLHEQGISVIAIAGNHDAKVLDQFNRALGLSGFCLLGADGNWERKSFNFRGRTLHIDGISFTDSFMRDNPLLNRKWEPVPHGDVLIGLLHCDVDVMGSKYAPVKSSDFCGLPHNAWILGHVHIPKEIYQERPLVRYCGSLQGLDIGSSECGPRGAWKLKIDSYGTVISRPLPLAPLRWAQASVNLSGIFPQDWESQVLKKIEEELAAQIEQSSDIEMVGVRLKFEGRTKIYRELRRNLSRIQEQEGSGFTSEGRWIPYFVESVKNNTRPELDLKSLAEGRTIVATLARKLLQVQENQTLSADIYERLKDRLGTDPFLKRCEQENAWPEEAECLELYLSQGYELLDELLAQIQVES
jgi:DNA repair exonuclease